MQLSPLDIRKQDFERKLRGVDGTEVEAFLEMVANQWEEMQDKQRRLEDNVRELENKLEHYQQVEEALQEALQTARENSQQKVENAERRADVLIEEAKAKSKEIRRDAKNRREQLQQQVNHLTTRRSELIAELRGFLNSELELLSRFDDDRMEASEVDASSADALPDAPAAPNIDQEMAAFSDKKNASDAASTPDRSDGETDEMDAKPPVETSAAEGASDSDTQPSLENVLSDSEFESELGDAKDTGDATAADKEKEASTSAATASSDLSGEDEESAESLDKSDSSMTARTPSEKANNAGWIVEPVFDADDEEQEDNEKESAPTSEASAPSEEDDPDSFGQSPPPDELEKIRSILNELD